MSETTTMRAGAALAAVLYWLLPIPVTLLCLSLISRFQEYHDLGVSMGANNAVLMFFVGPVLLAGLYAVAVLALALLRRWLPWRRLAMPLAALCVVVAGCCAFLWKALPPPSPPSDRPPGMAAFLDYYVRKNFGDAARP